MPEASAHCPFLNRSDRRCSDFFTLDHLQHAFKYCFDGYANCPVYREQLAERQTRRGAVATAAVTTHGSTQSLVTVTIPARYAQSQRAA